MSKWDDRLDIIFYKNEINMSCDIHVEGSERIVQRGIDTISEALNKEDVEFSLVDDRDPTPQHWDEGDGSDESWFQVFKVDGLSGNPLVAFVEKAFESEVIEEFNLDNFKRELQALLTKHHVALQGDYEGDTHGIDSEKFVVTDYKTHKEYVLNDSESEIWPKDLN